MHHKDQPMVWEHPVTGEYKIPPSNDAQMPSRYELQGYVERRFSSYYEHAAWCRKHGLVNHQAEGITVDKDALGKNKWGY